MARANPWSMTWRLAEARGGLDEDVAQRARLHGIRLAREIPDQLRIEQIFDVAGRDMNIGTAVLRPSLRHADGVPSLGVRHGQHAAGAACADDHIIEDFTHAFSGRQQWAVNWRWQQERTWHDAPVLPVCQPSRLKLRVLSSVNASIVAQPLSRPTPERFTPPIGAFGTLT